MKVFVVSGIEEERKIFTSFLKREGYDVLEASNGEEALYMLEKESADVMIIDIDVVEAEGLKTTKRIRELNIPVYIINLSAFVSEKIDKSVEAGADLIMEKPLNFLDLSLKLKDVEKYLPFYLKRSAIFSHFIDDILKKEEAITELRAQNENLPFELIYIMYRISEYRDDETSEHTMRVGWISGRIAERLGCDEIFVTEIQFAAPLHDLGKIGIPDRILLKPDKLTQEEYEFMKTHTEIGYSILKEGSSSILERAAEIALTHHERWNGSGYPKGLKGEEIPLSGQIVAVADSFDAIVSKRPYKKARPLSEGFDEIEKTSGVLYSPKVVEAFLSLRKEIEHRYRKISNLNA
jgi:putative two-component system response regulator